MPQWADERPRMLPLERGLRVQRWLTDHPPRGFMKKKLGERVDVWNAYDFLFPGVFLQRTSFYPGRHRRAERRPGARIGRRCSIASTSRP